MAGSFSDYLEDKVLKHVFTNTTYTPAATLYVALYTVAPTDAGGGTEVSTSGTNYARQSMAFAVSGTSPTQATNTSAVEWGTAASSWGTIVAAAVFDASTGGNMLAWADLTNNKTISAGDVFRFPASSFTVTLA